MVSYWVILSGRTIKRPSLFPLVTVNTVAHVDESILMDGVEVGRHSRIRRAIIDKGVKIPPRTTIGYDLELDRKRFTVSESGIVVIPKGVVLAEEPVMV